MNPRIVVTVDMIATGTDVKPLECLLFMRVGQEPHLLRADDRTGRADHRRHRLPGGHRRRPAQGPLRRRRRGRRHRDRADRDHPAAGAQAAPEPAGAVQAGRLRQQGPGGGLEHRRPAGAAGQAADQGGPGDAPRPGRRIDLGVIAHGIVEALDPDNAAAAARAAGASEDDAAALARPPPTHARGGAGTAGLQPRTPQRHRRRPAGRTSRPSTKYRKDTVLFAGHSEEGARRRRQ